MEMGRVGMRCRGGVGVGITFVAAFFVPALFLAVAAFFGAGGVVEIEEEEVVLVGLVDEDRRRGCCAMVLGLRRPRNSEPAACRSIIAWSPKEEKRKRRDK